MTEIVLKRGDITLTAPEHAVVAALLARATTPSPLQNIEPGFISEKPPRIGEFWRGQGGIYAGLMRGENGQPDYHLIVPTDGTAFNPSIAWGSQGEDEQDAASSSDGLANTIALAESEYQHPAAEWAASLQIDGHADFYLPSRREQRLCWVNVPELFADGWYWSSTQYSPIYAWYQFFGVGLQYNYDKGYAGKARAVRRVLAI